MIKHYALTTLRALRRDAGYSSINIVGLAVGLACCLLILVFISDEMSYDRFHENGDRIVRLALETRGQNEDWRGRVPTFYGLADMVGGTLSGVEKTVRLAEGGGLYSAGDETYREENVLYAEAAFFDVFTIDFVRGDAGTAFRNPYSVVLTEAAARKYFGGDDPLGRTLTANNDVDFEVTGIIRSMPANSHMHFDMLVNLASTLGRYSSNMFESLGAQWIYTYVLLERPETAVSVASRLNAALQQFIPPDTPVEVRIDVQALADIHLRSNFEDELGTNGNLNYLYTFAAVAVFILLIACVNFMNLATARASVRSREVGVRKLLGAHRIQLVRQFLSESVGLSVLAVALAIVLATLSLPVFNSVTGKTVTAATLLAPGGLVPLAGLALIVGLLAGSYPAFFLAAFRPARVLKGAGGSGRRGMTYRLRQGLVIFQFALSIAIVLGTLTVVRQVHFMQKTYPGFDRDQILSVSIPGTMDGATVETLKSVFEQTTGVSDASSASHAPPEGLNSWRIRPAGADESANELVSWIAVDYDYIETLGLDVVDGRGFSEAFPSDAESGIVINEAMARHYGLEEPVGSRFDFEPGLIPAETVSVVGVVRDFHQSSMHTAVRPAFLFLEPYARQILLRVDTDRVSDLVPRLRDEWRAQISDWPFEYAFLDDRFDTLYRSEQQLASVFRVFAGLAVFVACMGLFGLSAFMTARRTREVGVRKVFGASVGRLVGLLTREFLVLVVISFAIAAPISWFGMSTWLDTFAFRADIGIGLFALTAGLAIVVAAGTVGIQAVRAALSNPVKTLRYE